MDSTDPKVSLLIEMAEGGDAGSADKLFTSLYRELHQLARYQLARESSFITLTPTTLLHQAYVDIAEREGSSFPDRARFMGYAARVMRGLIIDHARNRRAQKRGGTFEITSLSTENAQEPADERELTKISDALDRLAKAEPALAQLVDLKFFCGFSFAEIGAMQKLSERTVQRHWEKARIYLHRHLRADLLS
jgi:RNA polymerase sigma factor (TIGR02999 family)